MEPFFFTWTAQNSAKPLEITSGSSATFQTPQGDWIDLGALSYQVNAGHGHPDIIRAIQEQAGRLCVAPPTAVYPEKRKLAEKLLAIAPPGFDRVLFTLGGTDANEAALRIARLYTKRYKVISRYRSYHGATMGSATLTGDWRRAPVEPGMVGVVHVLDLDHGIEGTLIPQTMRHEGNVGAVVLETMVGHNGALIPDQQYYRDVRKACDEHGALWIADEVLVGFGRTGKWLAIDHYDVKPDLITLGKGLTSGYGTLGAVLVHERISKFFDEETLVTGLTHYAHPIGIASALAAIDAYEKDGLIKRAEEFGAEFKSALSDVCSRVPSLSNLRCVGMYAGMDVDLSQEQFNVLSEGLRNNRVHTHLNTRTKTLVLSPPLCIRADELKAGIKRLLSAFELVHQ